MSFCVFQIENIPSAQQAASPLDIKSVSLFASNNQPIDSSEVAAQILPPHHFVNVFLLCKDGK